MWNVFKAKEKADRNLSAFCIGNGNLLRLTSFPQERTEQCSEPLGVFISVRVYLRAGDFLAK